MQEQTSTCKALGSNRLFGNLQIYENVRMHVWRILSLKYRLTENAQETEYHYFRIHT
jgi:hypothetical protein